MRSRNPEPTKVAVVEFRVTVSVPRKPDSTAKSHRHYAADRLSQQLGRGDDYSYVPHSIRGFKPASDTVRVDFDVTVQQLCDPPSRDREIKRRARNQIKGGIVVHDDSGVIHDKIPF